MNETRTPFTSPRLLGEVDARSAAGEGHLIHTPPVAAPPHPDSLPANGEREKLVAR